MDIRYFFTLDSRLRSPRNNPGPPNTKHRRLHSNPNLLYFLLSVEIHNGNRSSSEIGHEHFVLSLRMQCYRTRIIPRGNQDRICCIPRVEPRRPTEVGCGYPVLTIPIHCDGVGMGQGYCSGECFFEAPVFTGFRLQCPLQFSTSMHFGQ